MDYTHEDLAANMWINEAEKNGETQSGAEGDVTDAIAKALYLDSHYGVFNIHLTDDERKALNWRINAPYDNQPKITSSRAKRPS